MHEQGPAGQARLSGIDYEYHLGPSPTYCFYLPEGQNIAKTATYYCLHIPVFAAQIRRRVHWKRYLNKFNSFTGHHRQRTVKSCILCGSCLVDWFCACCTSVVTVLGLRVVGSGRFHQVLDPVVERAHFFYLADADIFPDKTVLLLQGSQRPVRLNEETPPPDPHRQTTSRV